MGLWRSGSVLVAVNLAVAWPLFFVEYVEYPESITGLWVSLARYFRHNWPDLGWYPLWGGGMPFAATYQPLLHALAGAVATLADWSPARAFHVALATLYVLGPVTLFLLLHRLLRSTGYALAGGLLVSLVSPSHFLATAIREDTGALWGARRLYAALAWGDAPHVASLTFIPVAILAIDLFVRQGRRQYWLAAAGGSALVFLTNIPGTIALAMGAIGYTVALRPRAWASGLGRIAASGMLAYALCAVIVPPSVLVAMAANVGKMASPGSDEGREVGLVLAVAGLLAVRAAAASLSFPTRFAACFSWIVSAVTLGSYWFDVSLLEQPRRFQMAMELALTCLIVCGAKELLSKRRTVERLVGISMACACAVQVWNYAAFARRIVKPMDMTARSEYKVARWFGENANGARVYVPGATAFWLNAFTPTPQLTGCCSQNRLLDVVTIADYVIGSDDGAGDRAVEISRLWLQALGVDYVSVAGPRSTEPYQPIRNWKKFDGAFEEAWRDGDDVIYHVPGASLSLAHSVRPEELASRRPENGVDTQPLEVYAAAVSDSERPALSFEWRDNHQARIVGELSEGMVISVQAPYHPGWTAVQDQQALALRADPLGFLVIEPARAGPAEIALTFTGGAESAAARAISVFALLLTMVLLMEPRASAAIVSARFDD